MRETAEYTWFATNFGVWVITKPNQNLLAHVNKYDF